VLDDGRSDRFAGDFGGSCVAASLVSGRAPEENHMAQVDQFVLPHGVGPDQIRRRAFVRLPQMQSAVRLDFDARLDAFVVVRVLCHLGCGAAWRLDGVRPIVEELLDGD